VGKWRSSEPAEQLGLLGRKFLGAEDPLGVQVGEALDEGKDVALAAARGRRVAVGRPERCWRFGGGAPSTDRTGKRATSTPPYWLENVSDPPAPCCCENPLIWWSSVS
jgi:hypothetical protein